MIAVYDALEAFLQEHRRCGELEGGAEGERASLARDYGATLSAALVALEAGPTGGIASRRTIEEMSPESPIVR